MACNNCGKTAEGCGCEQKALHISQICNPIVCDTNECSETFDAQCILYTGDDIVCDSVILATSGETVAQMVSNVVSYFCTESLIESPISCGVDVVVPAETTVEDAISLTIAYFCARLVTIEGDITTIQDAIVVIQGDIVTIQGNIVTIQGDVTTIQGQIVTILIDITNIQGDIITLQSDVTALQTYETFLTGLISQSGGAAPILTTPTAGNTIGTISWNYDSTGVYTGTLIGAFTGTVVCILTQGFVLTLAGFLQMTRLTDDTVQIRTFDATGTLADDMMGNANIRIEVYA